MHIATVIFFLTNSMHKIPAGDLFTPAATAAAYPPAHRDGEVTEGVGVGKTLPLLLLLCGCCSKSCSLHYYCISHTAMAPELPDHIIPVWLQGGESNEASGGVGD